MMSLRFTSMTMCKQFMRSKSLGNLAAKSHKPFHLQLPASVHMFSTIPDNNKQEEKSGVAKISGKFKEMWGKYGIVFVATYFSVYGATLGSIFLAMDYGVFSSSMIGIDPVAAVEKACDLFQSVTGHNSLPQYIRENPRVGTFAIAWATTKLTEPLRLALSMAICPTIARAVGRAPPKEKKEKESSSEEQPKQ